MNMLNSTDNKASTEPKSTIDESNGHSLQSQVIGQNSDSSSIDDKADQQTLGQSIGKTISQTISRLVDEIEIELENQIENHLNQGRNESELNENRTNPMADSNDASNQLSGKKASSDLPANHHDHATTMSSISEIDSSSDRLSSTASSTISFGTSTNKLSTSTSSDNMRSFTVSSNDATTFETPTNSTSTNDRTTEVSNEVSIAKLNQLRLAFRTFGSIFEFIFELVTDVFDEFAEGIISRTATLILNAIFDKATQTFIGI